MALNGRRVGRDEEDTPYNPWMHRDWLGGYPTRREVDEEEEHFERVNPYTLAGLEPPERLTLHPTFGGLRRSYHTWLGSFIPINAKPRTPMRQPKPLVTSKKGTERGSGC